jgi:hypothetical protein
MRLIVDSDPEIQLSHSPQIAIALNDSIPPELLFAKNFPRPDRHLLLGLVQNVTFAVEEMDLDIVTLVKRCAVSAEQNGTIISFGEVGLLIIKDESGKISAIVSQSKVEGRRIARQALRYFTGTIRLDIP